MRDKLPAVIASQQLDKRPPKPPQDNRVAYASGDQGPWSIYLAPFNGGRGIPGGPNGSGSAMGFFRYGAAMDAVITVRVP